MVLKSGRSLNAIYDGYSLTIAGPGQVAEGYDTEVSISDGGLLSKEERREVADMVIAQWNAWVDEEGET